MALTNKDWKLENELSQMPNLVCMCVYVYVYSHKFRIERQECDGNYLFEKFVGYNEQ